MERRRQSAAPQHRKLAARLNKVKLAKELDPVADTKALVEIEQVCAAAQENVLAVIDGLGWFVASGGRAIRCRAAAQERAHFEEIDVYAHASECCGSR